MTKTITSFLRPNELPLNDTSSYDCMAWTKEYLVHRFTGYSYPYTKCGLC